MCKGEGGLSPFTFIAVPLCMILTRSRELEILKPQLR